MGQVPTPARTLASAMATRHPSFTSTRQTRKCRVCSRRRPPSAPPAAIRPPFSTLRWSSTCPVRLGRPPRRRRPLSPSTDHTARCPLRLTTLDRCHPHLYHHPFHFVTNVRTTRPITSRRNLFIAKHGTDMTMSEKKKNCPAVPRNGWNIRRGQGWASFRVNTTDRTASHPLVFKSLSFSIRALTRRNYLFLMTYVTSGVVNHRPVNFKHHTQKRIVIFYIFIF